MGMEVVDLDEIEIDPVVINKVPTNLAKSYNVIPIKFENGILTVAMSNPHGRERAGRPAPQPCTAEVQGPWPARRP